MEFDAAAATILKGIQNDVPNLRDDNQSLEAKEDIMLVINHNVYAKQSSQPSKTTYYGTTR